MSHSVKRKKSKFEQARMAVPEDIRHLVGKREWTKSLETTDPEVARLKRAEWVAEWSAEIIRCREANVRRPVADGLKHLDNAFTRLAKMRGSLDAAIRQQLALLASFTCDSWVGSQENEDLQWWGEFLVRLPEPETEPVPSLDTEDERRLFWLREQILEGRGIADGLVHQELAGVLLERRTLRPIWCVVSYMRSVEPRLDLDRDDVYEAVAEAYLTRLVQHRFENWKPRVREALVPLATAFSQTSVAPPAPAAPVARAFIPPQVEIGGPTVNEAFAAWRGHTKARVKSQDEFASALRRFVGAFGDMPVATVDRKTAREFRNLLLKLPVKAPKSLRDLPLHEQAARAEAQKLQRLSPRTVKKHLQALYTSLSYARDEMDATIVPDVFGVTVDCSEVMGDERLPFSGEQLAMLFSTPLMTTGEGEEAAFWFMLLGPLTGCRIEELAQLRPGDIRQEDGVTFIDICRESVRERRKKATEGQRGKGVKTRTSLRRIPLHPILIDAGFLELVESARARSAEWLFNLKTYARYEQRGKYMSNKLNKVIDDAGITEPEYVFHSFRHSMKQALRNVDGVKEEISDLLTGHSFAVSVGRKYGRGAGLKTLDRAIRKISYPDVNWTVVVSCAKARH